MRAIPVDLPADDIGPGTDVLIPEISEDIARVVDVDEGRGGVHLTVETIDDRTEVFTAPAGTSVTTYMPVHDAPRAYRDAERAAARAHMLAHPEMYGPWEWPDALQSAAYLSLPAATRAALDAMTVEPPPLPETAVAVITRALGSADRQARGERPDRDATSAA